jgi:hypothetical protein
MLFRFAPKAYDVLFKAERGEYGAHSSILGAAEIASGIVYSGMYRLLWIYFGQPTAWTGTALSSLGLFMIAKGSYRLAISPDDLDTFHQFYDRFWLVILWLFSLVIVFIAGAHFSSLG